MSARWQDVVACEKAAVIHVCTAALSPEPFQPASHVYPLPAHRSTTYEPPSEDLLEAVTELVKYATVADSGTKRQPAQGSSPWLPAAQLHTLLPPAMAAQRGGSTAGPAAAAAAVPIIPAGPAKLGAGAQPQAQALARRLYRFFRRALTLWPEQRSIKPLLRCFLAYIAPWRTSSAAPLLLQGAATAAPGHSALASHLTAQVSDLVQRVHWADGGKGDGSSRRVWLRAGRRVGVMQPQMWCMHVGERMPWHAMPTSQQMHKLRSHTLLCTHPRHPCLQLRPPVGGTRAEQPALLPHPAAAVPGGLGAAGGGAAVGHNGPVTCKCLVPASSWEFPHLHPPAEQLGRGLAAVFEGFPLILLPTQPP